MARVARGCSARVRARGSKGPGGLANRRLISCSAVRSGATPRHCRAPPPPTHNKRGRARQKPRAKQCARLIRLFSSPNAFSPKLPVRDKRGNFPLSPSAPRRCTAKRNINRTTGRPVVSICSPVVGKMGTAVNNTRTDTRTIDGQ